jgi:hypothetical protein
LRQAFFANSKGGTEINGTPTFGDIFLSLSFLVNGVPSIVSLGKSMEASLSGSKKVTFFSILGNVIKDRFEEKI